MKTDLKSVRNSNFDAFKKLIRSDLNSWLCLFDISYKDTIQWLRDWEKLQIAGSLTLCYGPSFPSNFYPNSGVLATWREQGSTPQCLK